MELPILAEEIKKTNSTTHWFTAATSFLQIHRNLLPFETLYCEVLHVL